jgi:hypothetical protein
MKKAKLALMAIIIFGIVGGVMAFKAQKIATALFCTSFRVTPGPCDGVEYDALPGQIYITTPGPGLFAAFCTTDNSYACPYSAIYTTTNGGE